MQHQPDLELEVFRAGDYGARGTYTTADLDRIAGSYDPACHEAPVTFDHEQTGPAHGWVAGVRRVGDRLVATITRASVALRAAIATHAYKKRSVELYRQFDATGGPYLKAVTFLGAAAPAVKGLADPAFADDATADATREVVAFEEAFAPAPPAGLAARARLVATGRWRPEWEARGLLAVFDELAGSPQYDALLGCFADMEPPVPMGAAGARAGEACFAEVPAGASPESAELHRAAVAMQRRSPGMDYRSALLAIT